MSLRLFATVVLIMGWFSGPANAGQDVRSSMPPDETEIPYLPDEWETDLPPWSSQETRDPRSAEGNIPEERIARPTAAMRATCIAALKRHTALLLDVADLARLFPDGVPDAVAMHAAGVARLRTELMEEERAYAATDWRARSDYQRRVIAFLRARVEAESLIDPSSLKPYLVRSAVVNFGGAYTAAMHENELWMKNNSMGFGNGQKDPVVIFLERAPKKVYITPSSAI